jgi:hypothetical protein
VSLTAALPPKMMPLVMRELSDLAQWLDVDLLRPA